VRMHQRQLPEWLLQWQQLRAGEHDQHLWRRWRDVRCV
jgi:hypothetical protein